MCGGQRSCRTWAACDAAHAMLKLAVAVVAIALADCVNPSLIGGELFVATGEHPRRQTTAFAVAALVVTFVFGFALAVGLGDLILSLVPKPGRTVKYALIVFAGIVLVCGGAVVWIRRTTLVSTNGGLSLLVLYCVIYALPLIAIAVVIAVMGQRAERILGPMGGWLSAHWPVVVAPLTAAFGIGVLAFGIVQLSST